MLHPRFVIPFSVVLLSVCIAAAPARAQTSPPAATAPEETVSLIREGSRLVRVTVPVRRDTERGAWLVRLGDGTLRSPRHELFILPGPLLEELERIVEMTPEGSDVTFELSGRVYVFQNFNYLQLSQPPFLVEHLPQPVAPAATSTDNADDIIKRLEERAGTVPRRDPSAGPRGAAPVKRTTAREGNVVLWRRGSIRRTASGSYQFVFDADAKGLADPPATLQPCLMLGRLAPYARRTGSASTVLLSGRIHMYRGQRYMMPTMYRVPR